MIIENFMRCVDLIFPWDRAVVDATAQIRKVLSNNGNIIGSNDMAIASTAISTGSILITNTTKEFERVPGLKYENWVK